MIVHGSVNSLSLQQDKLGDNETVPSLSSHMSSSTQQNSFPSNNTQDSKFPLSYFKISSLQLWWLGTPSSPETGQFFAILLTGGQRPSSAGSVNSLRVLFGLFLGISKPVSPLLSSQTKTFLFFSCQLSNSHARCQQTLHIFKHLGHYTPLGFRQLTGCYVDRFDWILEKENKNWKGGIFWQWIKTLIFFLPFTFFGLICISIKVWKRVI